MVMPRAESAEVVYSQNTLSPKVEQPLKCTAQVCLGKFLLSCYFWPLPAIWWCVWYRAWKCCRLLLRGGLENVLVHMPCRQYCCPEKHLCRDVFNSSEAKRFNDRTCPKAEPMDCKLLHQLLILFFYFLTAWLSLRDVAFSCAKLLLSHHHMNPSRKVHLFSCKMCSSPLGCWLTKLGE